MPRFNDLNYCREHFVAIKKRSFFGPVPTRLLSNLGVEVYSQDDKMILGPKLPLGKTRSKASEFRIEMPGTARLARPRWSFAGFRVGPPLALRERA